MLWMVVNMGQSATPSLTPIEKTQNNYLYEASVVPKYNSDEYVVEILTPKVSVNIKSGTSLIEQIRDSKIVDSGQLYVDLTRYKKGTYDVPIQYTGFPKGIDISIQPRELKVKIDEKQHVEKSIVVDQLGKAADGFQTGDAIITPTKVHISGTKEQVDSVAVVKAFVNVEKSNKLINEEVPLHALDKKGNPVKVDITPQTVKIKIPVTSPFQVVPLTYKVIDQPKTGWAIQSIVPQSKDITLYGPTDVVNQYQVYRGPDVSVASLPLGINTIQLKVPLISGLYKTEPDQLQLEITIVKSTTKTFSNIPIGKIGLGKGFAANIISPTSSSVTLEGAPVILSSTQNDEVQAFVDLTNLSPGDHDVEIQYNIPLYTKVISTKEKARVQIIKE